jgi:hypothetical protein
MKVVFDLILMDAANQDHKVALCDMTFSSKRKCMFSHIIIRAKSLFFLSFCCCSPIPRTTTDAELLARSQIGDLIKMPQLIARSCTLKMYSQGTMFFFRVKPQC